VKLRIEERGVHCYDRETGVHVLLDEYPLQPEQWHEGPATVSIALTNICDLACSFCYAPKSRETLSAVEVLRWCKELADMGTFEIAFGGGEPTLYRGLPELCQKIWAETDLGISITTHGRHLTEEFITAVRGSVSLIRVSIDAPEPEYSEIRGYPLRFVLDNLKWLNGRIPFGINTVINSMTLMHLDDMALLVRNLGAFDWLLLPEVSSGTCTLSASEWEMLDDWVARRPTDLSLRISADAAVNLTCGFLFENRPADYAHIGANGYLRRCSYENSGIPLHGQSVVSALRKLKEQERVKSLQTTGASL
jgi:MoaA/NifB/PqqE/SkfB family radical SAM enzyme